MWSSCAVATAPCGLPREGLVDTGVALAVVPAGTANLFANGLRLPTAPSDIVNLVVEGHRTTIDSGVCNDMTFNVMAGTGLDAGLIDGADAAKKRLGMLSYVRAGLVDARRREPFQAEVTIDGAPFFDGVSTCVLVGNMGTLKGGLVAFPDASPHDGRLDVAVVTAVGLREWGGVMVSAARRRQASSGHAHLGRGTEIVVRLDGKHRFELDGGCKGTTKRLQFGIRPQSLVVCAPAGVSPLGCAVTGSPSRCARPPKITATTMNQPQPMARPARTSVSQCTPSTARLAATATAIRAAPAASRARTVRGPPRLKTKATAGHTAAAAAAWPEGNDAPEKLTSGITSGRSRSTSSFSPLTMSFSPARTTPRNTITSTL